MLIIYAHIACIFFGLMLIMGHFNNRLYESTATYILVSFMLSLVWPWTTYDFIATSKQV